LDGQCSVSGILRTALAVASKLDVTEFQEFCSHELNGYSSEDEIPEYRKVRGQVMVRNPFHGLQPVIVTNPNLARRLTERQIDQAIAELEDLIRRTDGGSDVLQMSYSPELLEYWRDEDFMQAGLVPILVISQSSVRGILDKVRTIVLEWALQLEARGVLGEGLAFTPTERQKAESVVYNIESVTGVVGGSIIAQNLQIADFSSVHNELKQIGISQDERNTLENIMDALPDAEEQERPGLVQSGMDWLERNQAALGALNGMLIAWFKAFAA